MTGFVQIYRWPLHKSGCLSVRFPFNIATQQTGYLLTRDRVAYYEQHHSLLECFAPGQPESTFVCMLYAYDEGALSKIVAAKHVSVRETHQ